jgi:hypothetical protein
MHTVLVDYPQWANAHMVRVVVFAKGKGVPRMEPTEIGDTAFITLADC